MSPKIARGPIERVYLENAVVLSDAQDVLAYLGQKTKAGSIPIVIASDQEARPWTFLGEQQISADGNQAATLPEGTTIIVVCAEVSTIRYKIGGNASAASMPVFVGSKDVLGPDKPLDSFYIFNAAGSVATLNYYKEYTE